ncbi:hypothetical protein LCGC14_1538990, partial [marine sediment metagenome]
PLTPSPVTNDHSAYNYQYKVEITVLESDPPLESTFPLMNVLFTIIVLGVPITIIVLLVKKRSNKKKESSDFISQRN